MDVVRGLAVLALLVWVWLTVGRGGFWRTDLRLPARRQPDRWPPVAVVVPARDEAAVLPETLPTLLAQRYPGPARVILVDDGSTDGTAALAERLADGHRRERGGEHPGLPLTVIAPGEAPDGWTGKLWAVRHGVAEAGEVEFLLLTDADIAHGLDSLANLVAGAVATGCDLVSRMAVLRTRTAWERLVVPAFVYFFAMLYPFRWVNRPGARTAAAAGGCCLVRRAALARAGGVDAIRGAVIDDVALGRAVKRSGGRIWLGLAEEVRSVRPYPTLGTLWRMVARSAYPQLRYSPLVLAATVLGLAVVFLVPPASTVAGAVTADPVTLLAGAASWLLMAATYGPMLRYYRQPVAAAFLLPGTALLYLLMTVDSAVAHWRGRGAVWKGRSYPASR
ncbi:glycosyl transferase family 2 [Gandjariella thermophila]|uniref:Glycosyl transferase family 2 n=2 Tax=Gandjariella thermophila TaxID=1931992 RepID=A0A4D4JDK1_9PSEU|nr:glycosyl transferase family 2 [Gandjariella thermophila]